ncbi:flavodoxin family protein [Jeotgalibacillus campisalis]|uniref:Putative NADPH-dependent FMN reductase n=1 Tax=Jeotgalibacillus campisalis TaxID=220754 RepID=A0A0C2VWC0_9BACL|nr:flavodoxin family protein [Jeotgalibacillus campisalis]KIL48706.1 putative NADPH-dependent FMN reductase [Jeotgalibacillus campisalis]
MHALFLNGSLKPSSEDSNTDALIRKVINYYEDMGITSEVIRLADYTIAPGVEVDMGNGDQWPEIFEKVKNADIVILGTPIWMGEKSSITKQAIERLDGGSSLTNELGQAIYYNKVGGVVVTGNEDGAKNAASSMIYALSHIGFTIPPNVDTYWVGEAGPGPSYMEAMQKGESEFTDQHVKFLAYNTAHFARMLKSSPIPPEGNVME